MPKATPFQWNGRIVNGTAVSVLDYPYQISMNHFGSHRCGGSIITAKIIVTAAHCVRGSIRRFTAVRAGSSNHTGGGVLVPVRRALEHEDYNVPYGTNNDIGLLFLETALTFRRNLRPVRLPQPFEPVPLAIANISGWGTLESGATTLPDVLQAAQVPIVEQSVCVEAYASLPNPAVISDVMVCAGLLETGGVDSCQGDSGGPLVIDFVLHGIVSWGYGCALPGAPGVYARTSHFIDWIDSKRHLADE